MRLARPCLLYLVAVLFPFSGFAQTAAPSPTPQRDPGALAAIQQAIAALGGAAAVARVTDTVVTGTIEPAQGSSVQGGTFTWENSGSDFKYSKQSRSSTFVLVSGHGHPASILNGTSSSLLSHVALANPPLHLPALVLAGALANKSYSVILIGKSSVNGVPAVKIRLSLDIDPVHSLVTPQDWYFDAASGIPVRVEHRLPDNRRAESYVTAAEEFGDYRIVAGVVMPYRILSYEDGQLLAVETINSVQFNTGISPSEFDAPAGGAQ